MLCVIRGKVPQVLSETEPWRMAHLDKNNAEAELGAREDVVRSIRSRLGRADGRGGHVPRQRSLAMLELPTGQGLVVKR